MLSGGLELLASCWLGVLLLVPRQPWAPAWSKRLPAKPLLSVHLDAILLGLMQFAAAFGIAHFDGPRASWVAALLVFGGWSNLTPYLARAWGVDAFVLAPPAKRFALAGFSAASVLALIVAWSALLLHWIQS